MKTLSTGIKTTGVTGAQGAQGAQGFQGAGIQGHQGNAGAQGLQGFVGAQGAQGLQGNQGSTGPSAFNISCLLTGGPGGTITHDTWTVVAYDEEAYDTDGMHSTSVENTKITVPSAGKYLVMGLAYFDNDDETDGIREIAFRVNGDATNYGRSTSSGLYDLSTESIVELSLAASDYIEMYVYQNSGNSLPLMASDTFFLVRKIGL